MEANSDDAFMQIALQLGRRGAGITSPNPCVGCIITADSPYGPVVTGRGWTARGGRPHAETMALEQAGDAARGATLYVTLEPCSHFGQTPPCSSAIIKAGIRRVVCALEDPDERVAGRGITRLREAGIEVVMGVGAEQARRDLAGHLTRITRKRPHVRLKLAISRNRKIAGCGGKQIWITGKAALAQVHAMRARHDAIMVGAGTVRADDPELTCRLPGLEGDSPLRVVVDTNLTLKTGSKLCQGAKTVPLWVLSGQNPPEDRAENLRRCGVKIIPCPQTPEGHVDLQSALGKLAEEGITSLFVEGGARLGASLLQAGLVDEADFFFSEVEIDENGVDALYGMDLEQVTNSAQFTLLSSQSVGADILRCYVRNVNLDAKS
jgi:diaminohydroxyphosphoribosylaminopyrimidine deaminase/5-amino-6-(5-phosphoribosylamino)uracil reductase